jgi:hypothetical protein
MYVIYLFYTIHYFIVFHIYMYIYIHTYIHIYVNKPGMVVHTYNPNTWEAEAGGSLV